VVDKPAGITSHDVVARCRRIFGQRKLGHGGTLDPGATGVLVVALGRATRLLQFVSDLPKSYTGEVVLGTETATLDADGAVTATHDMSGVTLDDVRVAAARLVGEIEQVPPMVSAVKVGGRRLHELAREGVEVERSARRVAVYRFEVEATDESGVFRIEVDCSSGTYVRVLAADLGSGLGGGAHLRNLRRTAVGPFKAGEAHSLEDLSPDCGALLPPSAAVAHLDQVSVDRQGAEAVGHGAKVPAFNGAGGPWAVSDERGDLLAVYERRPDGSARPVVVLAPR
jgi:tRNA pseudouridine55 synthase